LFQSTVKAPSIIDITTVKSISVFGIDNIVGDAALEALPVAVSAAMVPDALGTFVSVASVIMLVVPCEATTMTEVPI